MRVIFDQDWSKAELLKRLSDQAVQLIRHQYTGLQNITSLMDSTSRILELNTVFIVQPCAEREDTPQSLNLEPITTDSGDSDAFAVNLTCCLSEDGVDTELVLDPVTRKQAHM